MNKKIAVIANGTILDFDFHKKILDQIDTIICADGGANISKVLGFTPNYIIGDLDSIKKDILDFYKNNDETKIIHDANQNKTDLELALTLAESLSPSEIIILGASGGRIDHTIANILSLTKVKPEIKTIIIDDYCSLELVENTTEIEGDKEDIISVIPLTDILDLNYTGFKWNVEKLDTKLGWFGVSNKLVETNASISFSDGKILLIKTRGEKC